MSFRDFFSRLLVPIGLGLCLVWPGAAALAQRCSSHFPNLDPVFSSVIEYGDAQRKSDPYVSVKVNHVPVKMLLDTGSNAHVVWDTRLLGDISATSEGDEVVLDAIASSAPAREVFLMLEDKMSHERLQKFYVIPETPLLAEGFSGIVSPQFLAHDKVSIIDFKDNCFFVNDRFEPISDRRYRMRAIGAIPNAHRVMAIPIEVPGGRVPVVVDSGAYHTRLLASLIRTAPTGPNRTHSVDLLGNVVASQPHERFVDLSVNGVSAPAHPVIPVPEISEKGVVSVGAIGMDLLRDRIIFHDGDRHRFGFVEASGAAAFNVKPTSARVP